MIRYYILDGREIKPTADLMEYAEWFENSTARFINQTMIGDIKVSTVFLGLDHSFGDGQTPILFETMVFGGPLDQQQDRYSTYDEAEAGHEKMCNLVRSRLRW